MSIRIAERRRRTTDEIVAVAIEVMDEGGAAALSLGEVAKRMSMRTPSLYGYFGSKSALCDEIFRRGWVELTETMRPHYLRPPGASPAAVHRQMVAAMREFVGWALEHRASAELMFWRPIAGWEPAPEASAAAGGLMELFTASIRQLQRAGALRSRARLEEMVDVLTTITAGVITQQLANQPGVDVRDGRFSGRIDQLVAAFLAGYGATSTTS